MKAVLISIQPKWCELIANGKKTVEVRKTVPKLEPPFKCYIYCTLSGSNELFKDTLGGDVAAWNRGKWGLRKGNVIGEFICDRIDYTTKDNIHAISDASCVSVPDLWEYGRKSSAYGLYGWHISNLQIYDEPKPLADFYKYGALSLEELDEDLCSHCAQTDYGDKRSFHTPNGVSMCEGRWCDDAYQAYLDEEFALTRPPQSWCYVQEK